MPMATGKNIHIETLNTKPVSELGFEIVERKGIGHPDTICDAIAEEVSRRLSKYYLEEFGVILHHNVDKVLLVGGQANPKFGGGDVIQPIYILVAGRATIEVRTESGTKYIPIGPIILEAAKGWIKNNFRFLDPEKHVVIDYRIGKGSVDLVGLFELGVKRIPLANDTSVGVGFAPLTETEKLVLETEKMLNSPEYKKRNPAVGEDIKVMGLRIGDKIRLTVAAAIVSSQVSSVEEYLEVKERIKEDVIRLASKITNKEVTVDVNTADYPKEGIVYITVTGTSAEHGDDGMTGRGNRANGLITPMRPMSLEAAAGKNPVSHVGKIYNVLANIIASRIYREVGNVKEVYVKLLSQIGKPINQPQVAAVEFIPEDPAKTKDTRYEIEKIVAEELDNVTRLTEKFVKGELTLY